MLPGNAKVHYVTLQLHTSSNGGEGKRTGKVCDAGNDAEVLHAYSPSEAHDELQPFNRVLARQLCGLPARDTFPSYTG